MDVKKMLVDEVQHMQQLRYLQIKFDPDKCTGVWQCYDVCPVGCWTPDYENRVAIFHDPQICIACGA